MRSTFLCSFAASVITFIVIVKIKWFLSIKPCNRGWYAVTQAVVTTCHYIMYSDTHSKWIQIVIWYIQNLIIVLKLTHPKSFRLLPVTLTQMSKNRSEFLLSFFLALALGEVLTALFTVGCKWDRKCSHGSYRFPTFGFLLILCPLCICVGASGSSLRGLYCSLKMTCSSLNFLFPVLQTVAVIMRNV